MKIGIDVDGVLRDFCQGLEKVVTTLSKLFTRGLYWY